ncbi:MAG: thiamine pyrophosphate-binding protein [Oligoflexia bacterium]|nr:thiamine pyrophosphate-binding protein [Oligoflexia bacterium]
MRVADYVAGFLAEKGVQHVFLVTGGGAMHLNDAFGRCKGMEYIPCHHEQACAMAAESYFRMSGKVAAVNLTTGPGGTNALTGVYGAYVDSLSVFVVSGQVKWETMARSNDLGLRQLGDQEVDIISMAKPVTKYAEVIVEPENVRYHLEKAWHYCTTGRPGPVWLDIPMNVQGAMVDPSTLKGYSPETDQALPVTAVGGELAALCRQLLDRLAKSERPVVMAGGGIRISGQYRSFLELVERLGIPVVTAWNAHDLIWDAHPLYCGRPGTIGDRPGNFAVQNSDFLLVLGNRLNIRQVSYNWRSFARAAYKVMVDVDAAELKKPTLNIDLPIHASLQDFFAVMREVAPLPANPKHREYLAWCKERQRKYPVVLPQYRQLERTVNPYVFVEELFKQLPEGQKVVTGDGTACVATFQAAALRKGQRLYTNSGCASMGYDLPAAIGASTSAGKERVVCIAGDGSVMMNLQELQTIQTQGLPIKIFILNNQGYHSIRQTQQNFFPDNVVGCGTESRLGFPDFGKVAETFGMPFRRAEKHADLPRAISETLASPGAAVCEILLDLQQQFAPKLSSRRLPDGKMVSSPLEDLAPFLEREEFKSNMLIPLWSE